MTKLAEWRVPALSGDVTSAEADSRLARSRDGRQRSLARGSSSHLDLPCTIVRRAFSFHMEANWLPRVSTRGRPCVSAGTGTSRCDESDVRARAPHDQPERECDDSPPPSEQSGASRLESHAICATSARRVFSFLTPRDRNVAAALPDTRESVARPAPLVPGWPNAAAVARAMQPGGRPRVPRAPTSSAGHPGDFSCRTSDARAPVRGVSHRPTGPRDAPGLATRLIHVVSGRSRAKNDALRSPTRQPRAATECVGVLPSSPRFVNRTTPRRARSAERCRRSASRASRAGDRAPRSVAAASQP
jgi:hypothetical protein